MSAVKTQAGEIEEEDKGLVIGVVVLLSVSPVLVIVVLFLTLGGILFRESISNPLHDLRKNVARAHFQHRHANTSVLVSVAYRTALFIVQQADIATRRGATRADRQRGAKRVALPAAGLLAVAAFLLPHAARIRYAEEYQSELWDLAHAGSGQVRQLQYGLRQLRTALPTSVALRSPRCRSSAP